MSDTQREYLVSGRVEFHLTGGVTKVGIWAGGRRLVDIDTDAVPPELRAVVTWLALKLSSKDGWRVEGRGQPIAIYEEWLRNNPS
jgi:hypothetical protein